MNISQRLSMRTDLSTFVVHLTRRSGTTPAKDALLSILSAGKIEARTAMGQAVDRLKTKGKSTDSQKCVCFTETPLEHIRHLVGQIDNRQMSFEPYGIAMTKMQARSLAANPVWYVDITPRSGVGWLTTPLNKLIDAVIDQFDGSDIARVAPFIEQMGTGPNYKKEFWWEREWRCVGDLTLPSHMLVIAPEAAHSEIAAALASRVPVPKLLDAAWSLEHMLAHLAGFPAAEVQIL